MFSKEKRECHTCLTGGAVVLFGLMFMGLVFDSLIVVGRYEETTCLVSSTYTPNELPTDGNRNGWVTCDCGKRCQSYTPCARLYVNISDGSTDILVLESTITDMRSSTVCTFKEENCYRQQVWKQIESMEKSIEKMNNYESLKNSSTPIKCYTNQDRNEAYLENEFEMSTVLLISIPFGIFLLMFICVLHRYYGWCKCGSKLTPNDNIELNNV